MQVMVFGKFQSLKLKWLSIYSSVLQSSWTDPTGKGIQLQTLLSWSLPKGFQNKLLKEVATTYL